MKVIFVTSQVITKHATMKRAVGLGAPLLRRGWDVEVIAQDHSDNRDYFGAVPGLKATYFPALNAAQERIYKSRLIAHKSADLVHICGLGWRNALRRREDKIVLMDHVELESSLVGVSPMRRAAQSYLETWARGHYRATIAASRWLYHWAKNEPRGRVQHLPYGADPLPADVVADANRFIQDQQLGRYILYCGGLHRNYGFWLLIESAIRLCRRFEDFAMMIVGSGPELEAGRQAVAEAGYSQRIRLPGYVPERELNYYLSEAAAHVSPLNDTIADRARCPSKIALYMMTGKPVISCRIGEAVEYLGDHGVYYTPGSPESFEKAVERVWASPRKTIDYDLEKVSWDGLARRYAEFWQPAAAVMEAVL